MPRRASAKLDTSEKLGSDALDKQRQWPMPSMFAPEVFAFDWHVCAYLRVFVFCYLLEVQFVFQQMCIIWGGSVPQNKLIFSRNYNLIFLVTEAAAAATTGSSHMSSDRDL